MKNIRTNTFKMLVVIALFCNVALADGEMGGGGLSAPVDESRTGKSVVTRTIEDGEMGGGGLSADPGYIRYVVDSIYDYFDRIM